MLCGSRPTSLLAQQVRVLGSYNHMKKPFYFQVEDTQRSSDRDRQRLLFFVQLFFPLPFVSDGSRADAKTEAAEARRVQNSCMFQNLRNEVLVADWLGASRREHAIEKSSESRQAYSVKSRRMQEHELNFREKRKQPKAATLHKPVPELWKEGPDCPRGRIVTKISRRESARYELKAENRSSRSEVRFRPSSCHGYGP